MMTLTELLSPRPSALWRLVKQCGVDSVVTLLDGGEQDQRMFQSVGAGDPLRPVSRGDSAPWSEASIHRYLELYAEHELTVVAVEDTPPLDLVRLGLPGRDEQLDHLAAQIEAMGRLGVSTLCYNWMALSSWARTSTTVRSRGRALVTGFRRAEESSLPAIDGAADARAEYMWSAFAYFLAEIVPVAESAGVRLALHPDDPPLPVVRGVPRIMSSVDSFRRVLDLSPSPANAITLCQGNFALMTDDLPSLISEFGARGAIAFVHLRDVAGTADDFVETFHDDGPTDLAACLSAYESAGFDGPVRPDHVPTMYGEDNAQPGYGTLGRLFALGYIRGLQHAISGKPLLPTTTTQYSEVPRGRDD